MGTSQGQQIVILITDCEETCGGNPAEAIRELQAAGFDLKVNIVGFAISNPELKQEFRNWARLGNGRYFDARDAVALGEALSKAVRNTYHAIDEAGGVVASGFVDGPPLELPEGRYSLVVGSNTPITGLIVLSGANTIQTLTEHP